MSHTLLQVFTVNIHCLPLDHAECDRAVLFLQVTQEFGLVQVPAGMDQHQPLCGESQALGEPPFQLHGHTTTPRSLFGIVYMTLQPEPAALLTWRTVKSPLGLGSLKATRIVSLGAVDMSVPPGPAEMSGPGEDARFPGWRRVSAPMTVQKVVWMCAGGSNRGCSLSVSSASVCTGSSLWTGSSAGASGHISCLFHWTASFTTPSRIKEDIFKSLQKHFIQMCLK